MHPNFNQEGQPHPRLVRDGNFGGGILELRETLNRWQEEGMPGLAMTKKVSS